MRETDRLQDVAAILACTGFWLIMFALILAPFWEAASKASLFVGGWCFVSFFICGIIYFVRGK